MALFNKNSVGIDISDSSLEVVELKKSGQSVKVVNYNRSEIPSGVVVHGRIVKAKELEDLLENCLKTAKPQPIISRKIYTYLPEINVFIFNKIIPLSQKSSLKDLIEEMLAGQVPYSLEELVYTYKIRSEAGGKIDLIIIAVSKAVVVEWYDFFVSNEFDLENFDIKVLAEARAIFPAAIAEPVCIVYLGKTTTTAAFFDENGLAYSYLNCEAGENITLALVSSLGLAVEAAEHQKIAIGLKGVTVEEVKVSEIVKREMSFIVKDLQESLDFFFQKTGLKAAKIYLLGSTGSLPGLVEYVRENIKVQVDLAAASPLIKPQDLAKPSLFLGAIGAAMLGEGLDPLGADLTIVSSIKYKRVIKGSVLVQTLPGEDETEVAGGVSVLLSRPEKNGSWFAKHRKEAILVGVLVFTILLLMAALVYQSYSRAIRAEGFLARVGAFNHQQVIQVRLPLVVGSQLAAPNVIQGTIVTKAWNPSVTAELPTASQAMADFGLGSGLTVLQDWIKVSDANRELTADEISQIEAGQPPIGLAYPVTFSWLVMPFQEVTQLGLSLIKSRFIGNPFIYNGASYQSFEKTANPQVFAVNVNMDISFSNPVEIINIIQPDNFEEVISQAKLPLKVPVQP